MAQRRYHKFDPEKPERRQKTSSRAAARAWLRRRQDQPAICIQMGALGLAKRLKTDIAKAAADQSVHHRFLRDLDHLRKTSPELAERFTKDTRQTVLSVQPFKLRLRALLERPHGVEAQNRFGFAVAAIIGKVKGMKVEGLAALLMCCASRAAGVRDPRPTEAAAMAVAAGLDAPTQGRDQQERLEDNWVRRLALVQSRAEQAMKKGEETIAQYLSGD